MYLFIEIWFIYFMVFSFLFTIADCAIIKFIHSKYYYEYEDYQTYRDLMIISFVPILNIFLFALLLIIPFIYRKEY